jgi:hypothetical protein
VKRKVAERRMSTKTNDHEFGTRFDCPNMEKAILLANSHADVSGKMRGVWAPNQLWSDFDPSKPRFICDFPPMNLCPMVYVAIPKAYWMRNAFRA